ncbi:MAG: hypothetical protein RLZZ200_1123 [Pseudomonadota bacterium]
MSLIPDPLRPYLALIKVGVVVVLVGAAFVGGCSHERDRWTQKWADRDAADKAIADRAKADAKLKQDAADAAGAAREKELLDLRAYRDAHPVGPMRLCLARPAGVSPSAGAVQGDGRPGPGPEPVQPVPAGDRGGGEGRAEAGPDLAGMLDALAARADYVSAGLREWQRR